MCGRLWWKLPDAIPAENTSNLHKSELAGVYPEKFHCIWRSRTDAFDLNLKMASVSHVLKKVAYVLKSGAGFQNGTPFRKGAMFTKLAF